MSHHTAVPSDVEATSIIDLVNDCREVAGVLGGTVIDLTRSGAAHVTRVAAVPLARIPLDRLPFSFGTMPVEITEDLSASVAGYDDYGT